MLSIICVLGKNREIGYKNKLLWSIPEDIKRFKRITSGHIVVMGSKTFESIGKALPNRENIIITRNKNYKAPGCRISNSLNNFIDWTQKQNKEIFIIGGGQIYRQLLPFVDKLYLTLVNDAPLADTFFPDYSSFQKIKESEEKKYNGLKFKFAEFIFIPRKQKS